MMPMRMFVAAAFAGLLLPFASLPQSSFAQSSLAQSQTPAPPASAPPAVVPAPPAAHDVPKTYNPGLEQFMNLIQSEHAKLWYAGSARNWELAAYQLSEIKELMSDVQDLAPTFKNLPLAQMLDAVITGPIADLEHALDAKDARKFSVGYGKLTQACNSCHQATGNGFIVIQYPLQSGFPNQDFRPRK